MADDLEQVTVGTCRFCGQQAQVTRCYTQKQADERATLGCDCYQGKEFRNQYEKEKRLKQTIDAAKNNAAALFPDNSEISDLLADLVEPVVREKIDAVTVKVSDQVKVTVKGSPEKITIQKVTTLEECETT